ncbi:hypothetical protein H8K47_02875 [Undibacterium sp. CY7W]|uniref:Lipoprotein n=1 Tax=Undibacterium rugosum TaxID=2762291 RepID=A0A923KUK3_9BURK|nr:hypothetical protein [Undibacterium rugosum]MBC3934297.1 hypothetical protein [Undibacterium rugosum]
MKKKNLSQLLAGAVLLSALAACVTTYVPPVGGNTVQLTVQPTVLTGRSFRLSLFQSPLSCAGPMTVMHGDGPTSTHTTRLQANVLNTLSLEGFRSGSTCNVNFSFVPKAGRNYLLDASLDESGCMAVIYDVTEAGKPRFEESWLRRNVNGRQCVPLSESLRLPPAKANSPKSSLDDFKDLLPAR